MKADYWRQGVATILAAGLLAIGASAQEGAEGEVNITEKAPTAASPAETAKPAPKPVKPQIVDRDPFVNQLMTGSVGTSTVGTRTRRVSAATSDGGSAPAPAAGEMTDGEEVVEIPAPEVNINGIVSSGSGRQAIISTSSGTQMITAGMKLGDYKVSSIGKNYVTFTYGGEKSFKVEMDNEFGVK